MKTFLVERDIGTTPLIDVSDLWAASQRWAANMRAEGDLIFHLGSTYLPEEGRCLCLFHARNADAITQHSRAAHLPILRITSAVAFGVPRPPIPT
ncbi:MAG: nickel-binding protein [Paracoccaceae bacterium]